MHALNRALFLAAAGSLILGATACTQKTVRKTSPTTVTAMGGDAARGGAPDTEAEPLVRNRMLQSTPHLETVHFAYDSSELDPKAREVLAGNARWLKENPSVKVQVAGHCDQRGTTSYNLALGQRRAKAVREYYRGLGVPGGSIATISYGEEKPVCLEEAEACWGSNRRGETLIAFPEDMSRNGHDKLTP